MQTIFNVFKWTTLNPANLISPLLSTSTNRKRRSSSTKKKYHTTQIPKSFAMSPYVYNGKADLPCILKEISDKIRDCESIKYLHYDTCFMKVPLSDQSFTAYIEKLDNIEVLGSFDDSLLTIALEIKQTARILAIYEKAGKLEKFISMLDARYSTPEYLKTVLSLSKNWKERLLVVITEKNLSTYQRVFVTDDPQEEIKTIIHTINALIAKIHELFDYEKFDCPIISISD